MEALSGTGPERTRIVAVTSVELTMMGTTIRQDSTATTVCDGRMRPLRQEYAISSGGSTMTVRALYGPTTVTCTMVAGGAPSKKELPIPKGASIAADSSFLSLGAHPKVGAKTTVLYLNPLTVSLDKAVLVVEAVRQVELSGTAYDAVRVSATTPLGKVTSWEAASGETLWATLPLGMAMYRMPENDARSPDAAEPAHRDLGVAREEPEAPTPAGDFAVATAIVPDRPIEAPRAVRRLDIELSGLPSDLRPISDGRQTARPVAGGTEITGSYLFAVQADARRLASDGSGDGRYLKAAPYLDLDRREIRDLARKLRGPRGDARATASRIRGWVNRELTGDYGIGVPRSAVDVLRRKRGVCRDYATLFAAIARAAGVPTRLVGGIVYAEGRFYYHAWVECWVGAWQPYDATLGTDFVDATHVKLAHGDPTDMMQVYRAIGKLQARVRTVGR
jgi:hypothetical protein